MLTVQQLNSPIKGVDTLISSSGRIGFQVGSFAENYMIDELNIARSRLVALGSPQEYATALQNGTVSAIVDERPYVDLFLSDYCKFAIRGQEFTRCGWGFVSPSSDVLLSLLCMFEHNLILLLCLKGIPKRLSSSSGHVNSNSWSI